MVSPEDEDDGHYQSSYGRRQTAAYTNRDEEARDRLQARRETRQEAKLYLIRD